MSVRQKEIVYASVLLVVSSVFSLALLEIGLRLFTQYPVGDKHTTRPDKVLGYVMKSNVAGIDSDGFRNRVVTSQVDYIAIGDSHTYGYNVNPDASWPSQLSALLNADVYNMGIGGYGVPQYYELLNRALLKKPKIVVIGIYIPNDIRDVCRVFALDKRWANMAAARQIDIGVCAIDDLPKHQATWYENLRYDSAIVSLVVYYSKKIATKVDIRNGYSKYGLVVRDLPTPTLLSRQKTVQLVDAMDVDKNYNRFGLMITEQFLVEMNSLAKAHDVKVGVLLIPSKQIVYYHILQQRHVAIPDKLELLVSNEQAMTAQLRGVLSKNRIPFIEMVDELRSAVQNEADVYPANEDGHPLEAGYRIYAQSALRLINDMRRVGAI